MFVNIPARYSRLERWGYEEAVGGEGEGLYTAPSIFR